MILWIKNIFSKFLGLFKTTKNKTVSRKLKSEEVVIPSHLCYQDFYSNYDSGKLVDDTLFGVLLLSEDYIPNANHKYNQLGNYIVASTTNGISWKDFQVKTMSEIIDNHLKSNLKVHINDNKETINARIKVTHKSKGDKKEKLLEKIQQFDIETSQINQYQEWQELKELGVKYMVTYFTKGKQLSLGWMEEI